MEGAESVDVRTMVLQSYEQRADEARLIAEVAPDDECRLVWNQIAHGLDRLLSKLRRVQ